MVTKSALINAASISSLLLTTAAMITDKPKPKSKQLMLPQWAAWAVWAVWAAWAVWVVWVE